MKPNFLTSLFVLFLLMACENYRPKEVSAETQNETPKVLDDSKVDVSSFSKRYTDISSDIIPDLYKEAVEKDVNLKKLNDKLNGINEMKADSLKRYSGYFQNNEKYWFSANSYISEISDSVLRNDLKEIFKKMESSYQSSISRHNTLMEKLEAKERILKNYEILMKLSITLPMIARYQKNELPNIKTLNNMINVYDTLITETKKYSIVK